MSRNMSLLLAGAVSATACWIVYSVLWLSPLYCQAFFYRCAGCNNINNQEENQIVYLCDHCGRAVILADLRCERIDITAPKPAAVSTSAPLLPPVERHR